MARLHNINLAIKALHLRGLQTEANATHLVEGSQVQTLDFTWNVLIQLQVRSVYTGWRVLSVGHWLDLYSTWIVIRDVQIALTVRLAHNYLLNPNFAWNLA